MYTNRDFLRPILRTAHFEFGKLSMKRLLTFIVTGVVALLPVLASAQSGIDFGAFRRGQEMARDDMYREQLRNQQAEQYQILRQAQLAQLAEAYRERAAHYLSMIPQDRAASVKRGSSIPNYWVNASRLLSSDPTYLGMNPEQQAHVRQQFELLQYQLDGKLYAIIRN